MSINGLSHTVAGFFVTWLAETWEITVEAAPWLLGGFFLAGLIYAWVPVGRVARHLGGSGIGGVIKAAAVGVPLPLCSCSVIPVASSIHRQGASRGATASFLVSTPETGVDSIAISYALLGPFLAVARPIAALITAIAAGLTINRWDRGETSPTDSGDKPEHATQDDGCHDEPLPRRADMSCCHTADAGEQADGACCASSESSAAGVAGRQRGVVTRFRTAVSYGFGDMFADLAHWLTIGFFLAGLIGALVPGDFFERYAMAGPLSLVAVILVSLPLYVCATSSTPIAAVLLAKGMSPGTALVFLLVGPATNLATMVVVGRDLGRRNLAIYLTVIIAVAVACGLLTDWVFRAWAAVGVEATQHEHVHTSGWSVLAAIVLTVLVMNGLRMKFMPRLRRQEVAGEPACH
jgi:hypothetical protein